MLFHRRPHSSSSCCRCLTLLLLSMSLSHSSGLTSYSPLCCCIPFAKKKVCFHFHTVGCLILDVLSAYPVPVHCFDVNFFLLRKLVSTVCLSLLCSKGVVLISIMPYETIVRKLCRQGGSFICSRLSTNWPAAASTEPRFPDSYG